MRVMLAIPPDEIKLVPPDCPKIRGCPERIELVRLIEQGPS
jgi:hypothetical protein